MSGREQANDSTAERDSRDELLDISHLRQEQRAKLSRLVRKHNPAIIFSDEDLEKFAVAVANHTLRMAVTTLRRHRPGSFGSLEAALTQSYYEDELLGGGWERLQQLRRGPGRRPSEIVAQHRKEAEELRDQGKSVPQIRLILNRKHELNLSVSRYRQLLNPKRYPPRT